LTLSFLLALSFLALSFLALSFLALRFLALRFLALSFLAFSFAAFSLAVLFDRFAAVGAVVRGLARFGSPAAFVASVRRPVTRVVVLYSAVAVAAP